MDYKDYQKALRDLLLEAERDAYDRGYNDAVKKILAAARPEANADQRLARSIGTSLAAPLNASAVFVAHHETDHASVINIVGGLVEEFPGQRGTQLVDMVVQKTGERNRKRLDRTVRTALMRLKKRAKIEVRDGQWWPSGGG